MYDKPRYLLLQVRNPDDPMRSQEVDCFIRTLRCSREQITVYDLLTGAPSKADLDAVDVVLLGGSGDHSVAEGGPWLPPALEAMRQLVNSSKPTFASCWGFQAMAKALGGEVVTDLRRAELGTLPVSLTPEGELDPVFGPLGKVFRGQMGHQDIVVRLPDGATLLATTDQVENQAFTFPGKPIYATQFHPELNRASLLQRLETYPQYIEQAVGLTYDEFVDRCADAPETEGLLLRFVATVLDDAR